VPAVEGKTAEEQAEIKKRVNNVKNTCHKAIVAYVLNKHSHEFQVDDSGRRITVLLKESRVADYRNK
jgi:hypothetical protein